MAEMFILSQDGPSTPDSVREGALVMMRLPKAHFLNPRDLEVGFWGALLDKNTLKINF